MIYLWVTDEGWRPFELTDTEELKERGISIGDGASIGDRVSIGYRASIGDRVSIGYGAFIGDRVSIGYGASIGDRASIGDGAFIGDGASIGDRVSIGYRAFIGERAKPIIVRINGSRYPVSYWGEDRVDIGCTSRSIDAWLNDYADIAREHHFTAAEIAEYRSYVEFIKSVYLKTGKEEKQ